MSNLCNFLYLRSHNLLTTLLNITAICGSICKSYHLATLSPLSQPRWSYLFAPCLYGCKLQDREDSSSNLPTSLQGIMEGFAYILPSKLSGTWHQHWELILCWQPIIKNLVNSRGASLNFESMIHSWAYHIVKAEIGIMMMTPSTVFLKANSLPIDM